MFVALVVVVGFAVELLLGFGVVGVVIALVVAGVGSGVAYWKSDAIALSMSHARPADPTTHARLHNLVEGLCIAAGLPKPRIYVIDDDAPNAFATGRDPRHAAVAVTTGLMDKLTRIELEGVLADTGAARRDALVAVAPLAHCEREPPRRQQVGEHRDLRGLPGRAVPGAEAQRAH